MLIKGHLAVGGSDGADLFADRELFALVAVRGFPVGDGKTMGRKLSLWVGFVHHACQVADLQQR